MQNWIIAFLMIFSVACGDSPTTTTAPTPPPPPAPTLPSEANISGSVLRRVLVTSGQGNFLAFEFELIESGGLGANMNFVRFEMYGADGRFRERIELGANEIVRDLGTGRIEANQTRRFTVGGVLRTAIKLGQIVNVLIGITDDGGNDKSLTIQYPIVRAGQDTPQALTRARN